MAAVKAGQPVAIFEDPLPVLMTGVPGTSQPRRGQGGPMAMFQQQGQPKGDLELLWNTLGVELITSGGQPMFGGAGPSPVVVWQDYNPHPKIDLPSQFVFVDQALELLGGAGNAAQPGVDGHLWAAGDAVSISWRAADEGKGECELHAPGSHRNPQRHHRCGCDHEQQW